MHAVAPAAVVAVSVVAETVAQAGPREGLVAPAEDGEIRTVTELAQSMAIGLMAVFLAVPGARLVASVAEAAPEPVLAGIAEAADLVDTVVPISAVQEP